MLEVAEIFCGAGGMTLGLQQAGMRPRLGIDLNPHCISTYRRNFRSSSGIVADISEIHANDILSKVRSRDSLVLAGCPPCQPFRASASNFGGLMNAESVNSSSAGKFSVRGGLGTDGET